MFRRTILTATLVCVGASSVYADFSYEQTSKITGGMIAGIMKMAGAFSKAAREPMASTVAVKGNRMAHISSTHTSIIDLDKETITTVDAQKKQYSVMTFQEMAEAMDRMNAKMKEKNSGSGDMNFKVNLKDTGAQKTINGMNAHQVILTLDMQATDPKTGQTGSMVTTSEMWLAPDVKGYGEVRDFYKRMSSKMAWTPGAMGMMQRADIQKGMAEVAKQAASMDGVPVLQYMRMGAAGDAGAAGTTTTTRKASPPPPTAGEVAQDAATSTALGRLGGLTGTSLGGLGGLGRRKKPAAEQPAEKPKETTATSGDGSGSLIEMTTELTNFSSAAVDPSKFEVPAGFKKVDSEMQKAPR